MHAHHAGMPAGAVAGAACLPFAAGEQAGQHARTAFAVAHAFAGLIDCAERKGEGGAAGADGRRALALRMQHRPMGEEILRIAQGRRGEGLRGNGLHGGLRMRVALLRHLGPALLRGRERRRADGSEVRKKKEPLCSSCLASGGPTIDLCLPLARRRITLRLLRSRRCRRRACR